MWIDIGCNFLFLFLYFRKLGLIDLGISLSFYYKESKG